ncbi:MAG: hypothetical protein J5829_06945 [Lachnospiraceae bacterium]|nr:hypothetical protein [Lachnospiraceae bacterium]
MNGNDLMNALNGLDPKYIDEAAFELHEKEASEKRAKTIRFRRTLFVVIPAAAAILITMTTLLSSGVRRAKNESASFTPAADAAATGAAAPVYEEEAASEEASDEAPVFEEEAADAATEHSYDAAGADEAVQFPVAGELAENFMPEAQADEEKTPAAPEAALNSEKKRESEDRRLRIESVSCENGTLTVKIKGTWPENVSDTVYIITGINDDGSEKICGKGTVEKLPKGQEPLNIDISGHGLEKGAYTLFILGEKTEFEI